MSVKEKTVKKETDEILKRFGAYWLNAATGGYGESGHPDKVACVGGFLVGCENKATRGKVSALQVRQLKRIVAARGVACVIGPKQLETFAAICQALEEGDLAYAQTLAKATRMAWRLEF